MSSDEKTTVLCDGCTACCRTGQALVLHPEHGDHVQSYRFRLLTESDGEAPVPVLESDQRGRCVYLGDHGCTIYERRPFLCRSFDCRKHYLILPRQDRDNLVRIGLSSREVFDAGRSRVRTLSAAEQKECVKLREDFFS